MANPPRVDLLSNFQSEQILATVLDGIDDSDVNVEITLKSLTSQVVDVETGLVTRTSDNDTIDALRRLVTAEEIANAGTQLEPGDRVYLVQQSDLTKAELQTVDRIVEGADVLSVIFFAADPLNFVWQIMARII